MIDSCYNNERTTMNIIQSASAVTISMSPVQAEALTSALGMIRDDTGILEEIFNELADAGIPYDDTYEDDVYEPAINYYTRKNFDAEFTWVFRKREEDD